MPAVCPGPGVSALAPPEQGARASSHRLLRRWETRSFRVPPHPHPEEFSRKPPSSFLIHTFSKQLWQVSPLAEPGGQWRLNQHHSNPSGLPRPQRVSTCPPLERGAEGLPWLAPLPENPFFPCSAPFPPRRILAGTSQLLFEPRFSQTVLASPPGGTTGLKAAESTPLESQRSAQAPECQRLLPPEQSAGGFIPSPAQLLAGLFFPCSDPSPPRRILAETSQLLF